MWRSLQAERQRDDAHRSLSSLRHFVQRKLRLEHGEVANGGDLFTGFVDARRLPTAWGTCMYSNGDVYEGEWADGTPHGHGTCSFVGGNSYVGGWSDGGYHGMGVYRFVGRKEARETLLLRKLATRRVYRAEMEQTGTGIEWPVCLCTRRVCV